jgi:glucan phosphoethanolaminetransferase (alkaline phosphatase superfamily)
LSVSAARQGRRTLLQIVKSRGFGTFWIERQELDICRRTVSLISAAQTAGRAERTPADNQTVRSVFVIGPDKKIKPVLVYPMTTE